MKNYFSKLQGNLNKILKKIDTDLVDFFPIYGVKENVLCKYSIILNIDFSRVYGLQKKHILKFVSKPESSSFKIDISLVEMVDGS